MGACGGGGRKPAGSARRPAICPGFSAGFLFYPVLSCFILLGYLRKIDHWSIVGKGMSAYGDFLLDPAWFPLQNRSLVDFQEGPKQHQAD